MIWAMPQIIESAHKKFGMNSALCKSLMTCGVRLMASGFRPVAAGCWLVACAVCRVPCVVWLTA